MRHQEPADRGLFCRCCLRCCASQTNPASVQGEPVAKSNAWTLACQRNWEACLLALGTQYLGQCESMFWGEFDVGHVGVIKPANCQRNPFLIRLTLSGGTDFDHQLAFIVRAAG